MELFSEDAGRNARVLREKSAEVARRRKPHGPGDILDRHVGAFQAGDRLLEADFLQVSVGGAPKYARNAREK